MATSTEGSAGPTLCQRPPPVPRLFHFKLLYYPNKLPPEDRATIDHTPLLCSALRFAARRGCDAARCFSANMATRMAASQANAATAARLLHRTSHGYAAPPQLWSTSGDLAAVCWTGLIRVNGLSAGSHFSRAVHARGRHHLARYTHQLTCPPSHLASAQGSSLCRLVPLALQASVASWAMAVQVAPAADGFCGLVVGRVGGRVFHVHESGHMAVCVALWARLCPPLRIGLDPMDRIWIGWPWWLFLPGVADEPGVRVR